MRLEFDRPYQTGNQVDLLTKRKIAHDEAREIAQRLINSHFDNSNRAHISIPANPERDDDLLIMAYIAQQEAKED